jgi:hypothetical protein
MHTEKIEKGVKAGWGIGWQAHGVRHVLARMEDGNQQRTSVEVGHIDYNSVDRVRCCWDDPASEFKVNGGGGSML